MKEINSEFLCVLKHDKVLDQVVVDFMKIEECFNEFINKLDSFYNNPSDPVFELINFIYGSREFILLNNKTFNYCKDPNSLSRSYDNRWVSNFKIIEQIYNCFASSTEDYNNFEIKSINHHQYFEFKIEDIKNIKDDFLDCLLAYSIESAYERCKKDDSILTYSHRKSGWTHSPYKIGKNVIDNCECTFNYGNLAVWVITNFGYGKSSEFYVVLKYKNIPIIPYSNWIEYKYAGTFDIIQYTRDFRKINYENVNIINETWFEVLEYLCEACNLSVANEYSFIEKYIIVELKKMVTGLEVFMNDVKQELPRGGIIQGYEYVNFRGAKISGALDFLSNITECENIISVNQYIDRIKVCNIIVLPILEKEFINIGNDLEKYQQEFNFIEAEFQKVKNQYDQLMQLRNSQLKYHDIFNRFINNENIKNIPQLYFNIYREYCETKRKVDRLFSIKTNIQNYIIKIKDWLINE